MRALKWILRDMDESEGAGMFLAIAFILAMLISIGSSNSHL